MGDRARGGWAAVGIVAVVATLAAVLLIGWSSARSLAFVGVLVLLTYVLLGPATAGVVRLRRRAAVAAERVTERAEQLANESHLRSTRRIVLGVAALVTVACMMLWAALPGVRLYCAMGASLAVIAGLGYWAHKCCDPAQLRQKWVLAAASALVGVHGNYLASATAGGGLDAKALDARLGGVTEAIDRLTGALDRNTRAINELVRDLMARVEDQGRQIGDLEAQVRAAVERAVRAETAKGRDAAEVIAELRAGDPKKLIAFLDEEIERDQSELIEKHRERAAVCYVTGEIDKAIASLTKILALVPDDLDAMNEFGHVRKLRGELDKAEQLYTRVGEITSDDWMRSVAYGNLALVELVRGDIYAAEKYTRNSLELCVKLGRLDGIATDYINLAMIARIRGNLNAAQSYLGMSLEIYKKLGRFDGMAVVYGNLGLIEQMRGNLNVAEGYLRRSLELNEKLGRLEGMANQYGNLGLIELARANLDAAEGYLRRSLELNEKLGHPEGMANQYGNLGVIERTRGNLDAAEGYLKKSLAINEKLGRLEGIANDYGNLGVLEQIRGNLESAEKYLKNALTIEQKLDSVEGMASAYANLGLIERTRGSQAEACRLWVTARDLFRKIGMKPEERQVQGWLDEHCGGGGGTAGR